MLLTAALTLAMLSVVTEGGPNTPAGWGCKPLTTVEASHEDCISSANYNNGVWEIMTKKVSYTSNSQNRLCVVTVTSEGLQENKDFYVRGKFSAINPASGPPTGPFGGISFNMPDADTGNYIMMRLRAKVSSNLELGRMQQKFKSTEHAYNSKVDSIIGGTSDLEILINEDLESVFVDGVLDEVISNHQPFYVAPGSVGFFFQNVLPWGVRIENAELCTYCVGPDGGHYLVGEGYKNSDGNTCTCKADLSLECACGSAEPCPSGLTRWNNAATCETMCIPPPGVCSSTGDPHYRTMDGKTFDFHGECTYLAATCDDFDVHFDNIDLGASAPRYTKAMQLTFKGETFVIGAGRTVLVNGETVATPYEKVYTGGERVTITGFLEINLYSKGRSPSVRLLAGNAQGRYINAYMYLHGSCAGITEGVCGNWNGLSGDDLGMSGNPNTMADEFKVFDDACPAPPPPYDPCRDLGDWAITAAEEICDTLKGSPFSACHDTVSYGNADEGVYKNCKTDVCECIIDESCACSQYDVYAGLCITAGVDLSDWRKDVAVCPLDCPDGMTYMARGAVPMPTCLHRDPEQTGTERGCYCPAGKFLQDGVCVDANQCKCLHEGIFFNNGDEITKQGECKLCTCRDAGNMDCSPLPCDDLTCAAGELESTRDDECCPFCLSGWVEAVNPDNELKGGQKVVLTCDVLVAGVEKGDITWLKDGKKVTKGVSKDSLKLTIRNADEDDTATYTCAATKDGVTASADFTVDVEMPAECTHEDGTTFLEGTIYNPQETVACSCDVNAIVECYCVDDDEACEDPTPVAWFDDSCIKTCVADWAVCSAAADPFYVTFDGREFPFKGGCRYEFFSCGDIRMWADHVKTEDSSKTRAIEFAFKEDKFVLEGDVITLNGNVIKPAVHKTYKDGSELRLEDVGDYKLYIFQDGKEPLVELTFDKEASYSVKVHGSCKGNTGGMCGNWNDDPKDDYAGPNGEIFDTAAAFGTAWEVDDDECPEPPLPEDLCRDFGLDRTPYDTYVNNIMKNGPMKKCTVDRAVLGEGAVQQICECFGDLSCACPIINQYALECQAAGFKTEGWQNGDEATNCAIDCPTGTTYMEKGPKPAPSCDKPKGGKKKQAGCFCPEGQFMEAEVCTKIEECGCEYAGQLYSVGDKFEKPGECLECTCTGAGDGDCEPTKCNTKCAKDEIEVEVEGECCAVCKADWVTAVNPVAVGEADKPLELTCIVDGIEVTPEDVTWFTNPGKEEIAGKKALKRFAFSDDGLTLTIKKMSAKMEGEYKCVVDKDGKSSEGVFEASLPAKEADLVEAGTSPVDFVEGGEVSAVCNKLEKAITELTWECEGKVMENGKGNVKIVNKSKLTKISFKPATLANVGTCTCKAVGQGTEDSADVVIGGVENDVEVKAQKSSVKCTAGKRGCKIKFTVTATIGQNGITAKDVKMCKLVDGKPTGCKATKVKKGVYYGKLPKKIPESASGQYVAIVTIKGKDYQSEPVDLTVTAKEGGKKDKEDKEGKEDKKDKKDKKGKKGS